MKKFTIKKDSWHYKLSGFDNKNQPKNFCNYLSLVLLHVLLLGGLIFAIGLLVAVLFYKLATIYHGSLHGKELIMMYFDCAILLSTLFVIYVALNGPGSKIIIKFGTVLFQPIGNGFLSSYRFAVPFFKSIGDLFKKAKTRLCPEITVE